MGHRGRQAPRELDAGVVDALVDLAEAVVVLRLRGLMSPETVRVLAVAEALLVRRAAAGARVPGAPVHLDIAVHAEGVLAGQLGVDHLALDPVRGVVADVVAGQQARSEERRVGKEGDSTCVYRWWTCHSKKKKKKMYN